MLPTKDYTSMTLDELALEEKKAKGQRIPFAFLIGLIVGIAVWSAAHKGFLLPVALMGVALLVGSRHSKKLKGIQAEISRRETLG
ncbi:hypothetical protein CLV58_12232 [Spirosoma oryzae]|uniref:Uncharacterized protein n=1 Tax=Spirosoma oryzae TaxID=1469603 RepID=A0A2T0SE98_9BACT|nr:hypothetical protein [Spirosoma oryzae]PRY31737.1 hypothetical protein CLV58_12232 [Spirosoma oryzae]